MAPAHRQGGEVVAYAQFLQQTEHVLFGAPVLLSLKVALEAVPHFAMDLMNQHAAARSSQGDRRRKPGRTGAADLNRLALHAPFTRRTCTGSYAICPNQERPDGAAPSTYLPGSAMNALWQIYEQK